MSRKFSFWSVSCSAVKVSLGCILLKSSKILWMSEQVGSYMISMSSTYLKYPSYHIVLLHLLCLMDSLHIILHTQRGCFSSGCHVCFEEFIFKWSP
jgi:hypothetical protein